VYEIEFEEAGELINNFRSKLLWDACLAQKVNQLIADDLAKKDKILVLCATSHLAYGHGVPSRVFKCSPEMREASVSIFHDEVLNALSEEENS
jgi:hypothetical protein